MPYITLLYVSVIYGTVNVNTVYWNWKLVAREEISQAVRMEKIALAFTTNFRCQVDAKMLIESECTYSWISVLSIQQKSGNPDWWHSRWSDHANGKIILQLNVAGICSKALDSQSSRDHPGMGGATGEGWGVQRTPYFCGLYPAQGIQRNSHSTSALGNSASCTGYYYNDTENFTYRL